MDQIQEKCAPKAMRILVVCQHYAPEPFRLPDIGRELVRQGHQVTVVTGTPNYPEGEIYPGYEKGAKADEILDGVRVHRCPLIPRKTGSFFRLLNYFSFELSACWYLHWLRESFDVVFVNQLSPVMMAEGGLRWAKRHGKKCVLYCLDLWPESLVVGGIRQGSLIYKIFLGISRSIYRRADRILVSSRGFISYFEDSLGVKKEKIDYLPQYAEGLFEKIPEAEEGEQTNFLFAGNVGTGQSMPTIVEAARLLQGEKIHIHVVGGGACLADSQTQAAGLTNITFYGRRDVSEMPAFYAKADAMLVSLIRNPDMDRYLPGKVQSYMAAGKPIFGAIDGETARIVAEAECGECVPAEDAKALAEILRKASADPAKLKQFGENSRRYYEANFSQAGFMRRLIEILEENRT